MLILKQSTAVDVLIGPFLDTTDAATAETGESPTVKLSKNGQALGAKNDVTTPVHDADGYYNCELDATDTNTLGALVLSVAASGTALPVRHEFQVVDAAYYDALDGSAPLATSSQVSGIGSSTGGALNFEADTDNTGGAIKSITFVGTQTGTFANTEAEDGSYHQITHAANDFDIVYGFSVGGSRAAVEVTFHGYLSGGNDDAVIQVYDFDGATWDTISTLAGQAGTDNVTKILPLLTKHTGTGSDLGKVYVRIDGQGDDSSPVLYVDQLLVSAISSNTSIGYVAGHVWIDTGLSNTNTESFVDGTADNPVSTIAAAKTIAGNLNLAGFHILPGSSITLAASAANEEYVGKSYSIALGGQDITGAYFYQSTNLTGIGTGTNGTAFIIQECNIGTTTLAAYNFIDRSAFYDTTTFTSTGGGSADAVTISDCFSAVPGSGSPHFDFSGVTKTTQANIRRWSGGLELTLTSDCTVSVDMVSGGNLTINGTGGTVKIRGIAEGIVDNSSGAVEVDAAVPNIDQVHRGKAQAGGTNTITLAASASSTNGQYDPGAVLIVAGTGQGQMRDILGYNGTTKVAEVDKDWRTNPDATSSYVVFAKSGLKHVNEGMAQAGGASTITLNSAASGTDDIYIGQTMFLMGGTGQDQARKVTDYNGTTKVATVQRAWQTQSDSTTTYVMLPGTGASGADMADDLLDRDMSSGTDSGSASVRTVRQALRVLRNKVAISGTTMTVNKEDDSTSSWTAEVASDSSADPVTSIDPAS